MYPGLPLGQTMLYWLMTGHPHFQLSPAPHTLLPVSRLSDCSYLGLTREGGGQGTSTGEDCPPSSCTGDRGGNPGRRVHRLPPSTQTMRTQSHSPHTGKVSNRVDGSSAHARTAGLSPKILGKSCLFLKRSRARVRRLVPSCLGLVQLAAVTSWDTPGIPFSE